VTLPSMARLLLFTLFFIGCKMTLFSQNTSDSVRINIAILDTAKANRVSIVAEIKNLSAETKKILKQRQVDYVNGKIKPIGNYILEVERLEKEVYFSFPPTTDINPVFQNEYREVKPNGYLMETVNLEGKSWSGKGFPKGEYRVRIVFNWNEWSSSLKNTSKWITFTIE
jgi:hypothetical protein